MAGHAAIGVGDDLPTGESGIAHRAADDEGARGIDQGRHLTGIDVVALHHRGNHLLADLRGETFLQVDALEVLGGDHHIDHAHRLEAVIFDGHLCLAVGTEVTEHAGAAHLGQPLGEPVGHVDGQRHQFRGFPHA